jgi:hypothetical protein
VAAARAGHNTGRWWIGGGVLIVVVFALVLVLTIIRKGADHPVAPNAIPATPIAVATGVDGPPPWPAPTDVPAAVRQAGLPLMGSEGSALHIHAHLDVFVNGQAVPVPADIGIDQHAGTISPLHTHDGSGVIHIESPVQATFSLAQFVTEWQVGLSASRLGGLRTGTGQELRVYVNGQQVPGNPGALTLHGHDVIAVVYGVAPNQIPSAYDWGDL